MSTHVLTDGDAAHIKEAYARHTGSDIDFVEVRAYVYGVSKATVRSLLQGRTYRHVPNPPGWVPMPRKGRDHRRKDKGSDLAVSK